jgi:fimbrial chaperone protein
MSGVRGLIMVIAGMAVAMAIPVLAADFAVAPVDVTLGHRQRSQLIVITNQDVVPLRYQLSAYRWDEQPDGQMVLTPTDDVIFFPQLFDIAPHDSQNIRVGSIAPAIDSEKTYRLVLHQLKTFEPPRPAANLQRTALVNVLTNISIPVFVEPPAAAAHPGLSPLAIRNSTLSFTVTNSGNAHFRIKTLRVEGFGAGPQPVFAKTTQGWYVLAGGSRNYQLAMRGSDCSESSRLQLLVETDRGKLQGEAPINPGDCSNN